MKMKGVSSSESHTSSRRRSFADRALADAAEALAEAATEASGFFVRVAERLEEYNDEHRTEPVLARQNTPNAYETMGYTPHLGPVTRLPFVQPLGKDDKPHTPAPTPTPSLSPVARLSFALPGGTEDVVEEIVATDATRTVTVVDVAQPATNVIEDEAQAGVLVNIPNLEQIDDALDNGFAWAQDHWKEMALGAAILAIIGLTTVVAWQFAEQ